MTERIAFRLLGLAVALGSASPTLAKSAPSTRLVECAAGHCLLVSGRRDEATSLVRLNGHALAVEGKRSWKVRVPIETVRAWSAPFARSIEIALVDPRTQRESTARANLPIGMLGGITDLASLVISFE